MKRSISALAIFAALAASSFPAQASGPCSNLTKLECTIFLTGLSTSFAPSTLMAIVAELSGKLSGGNSGEKKLMEVVAPEAAEFLMNDGKSEASPLLRSALEAVRNGASNPALVSDTAAAELLIATIEELR